MFGAIGLCVNALARGYDFFTYYFTLVLTPMTFLSGVYYPVTELPGWLAALAGALPLAAAVELARPLVLGRLPERAAAAAGDAAGLCGRRVVSCDDPDATALRRLTGAGPSPGEPTDPVHGPARTIRSRAEGERDPAPTACC